MHYCLVWLARLTAKGLWFGPPLWSSLSAKVSGGALSWLSNYLSGRKQFVALGGACSSLTDVTSGVPQGSILGPLLFLVAFNGIFSLPLSPSSTITGYADDATYSKEISSDEDLVSASSDLDCINGWIKDNGFCLNAAKVKAMVISRRKDPPVPSLVLNGKHIEVVNNFK